MNDGERGFLLRTLGFPLLTGPGGEPVGGLRRKDLSLLAYLVAEGPRPHSRSRLAALLWGVWLHGEAGAALARKVGTIGYLAREISAEIPALLERSQPSLE